MYKKIRNEKTNEIEYIFLPPNESGPDYLGEGQFGKVYRGYRYDSVKKAKGEAVAIKIMSLHKRPKNARDYLIKKEVEIF